MPAEFLTYEQFAAWEADPQEWPDRAPNIGPLAGLARLWNTIREGNPLHLSEATSLPGTPAAMLVLRSGEPWTWVVACSDGQVVFGRATATETARETHVLKLAAFDEDQDEPLSIFAERPRWSGETDVYVLVRRVSSGREITHRIHGARVRASADSLQVEPVVDGQGVQDWPAMRRPESELPSHLKSVGLSVAPDLFPLDMKLPQLDATPLARVTLERGDVRRAALAGERVFLGTESGWLMDVGNSESKLLTKEAFDSAILGLAAASHGGGAWLAVADGTQCVAGFHLDSEKTIQESWRRRLDETAQALALLPRHEAGTENDASAWPDLLVAQRAGELLRLRHVAPDRLQALWERELGALAGGRHWSAEDWVTWASTSGAPTGNPPDTQISTWGRCVVLLDRLRLEPTHSASEEEGAARWVGSFHYRDLWSLLGRAVQDDIRAFIEAPQQPRLSWRFLLALHRAGGLELKDRIDQEIRILQGRLSADGKGLPTDPDLGELVRLARIQPSAWWAWAEIGPIPHPPTGDLRQGLHFLANRAAEAFLLEDYHVWTDFRPRGLAAIRRGTLSALVVMGRDEVRLIQDGSKTAKPIELHSAGAILRTLRRVELGPEESVALVGAQGGFAFVIEADGSLIDIQNTPARVGRGVISLPPAGDGRARFGVLWNEARSSILEIKTLSGSPGARVLAREGKPIHLPLSRVSDIDACSRKQQLLLAFGSENSRKLLLQELFQGPEGALEAVAEAWVESPIKAIRFDPTSDVLYVGTRGGLLWAFRLLSLEPLWVYRAGRAVRSLELLRLTLEGEKAPRTCCLVASDPEDIFVVDDRGRRVWHRRMTRAIRSARVLDPTPGSERIGLACPNGYLALYRRAGLAHHRDTFVKARSLIQEPGTVPSSVRDLWDALACTADGASKLFPALKDRRARHALTKRLLTFHDLPEKVRLTFASTASFREMGALLSHLPEGALGGWWRMLFDRLVKGQAELHGDNSSRALKVAFAEALRHSPSALGGREDVETLIQKIPRQLHGDAWVALEAARCWRQALEEEAATEPHDSDRLLSRLHGLPASLAWSLRHVVRPPALGYFAAQLGRVALDLDARCAGQAPALLRLQPGELNVLLSAYQALVQDSGKTGPLATALGRLLELAHAREDASIPWSEILELIRLSRRVTKAPELPFRALAALPATLANRELPEETWELALQREWVNAGCTAPVDLLPGGHAPASPWERLVTAVGNHVLDPIRRSFVSRLRQIESLVRGVPAELRFNRPFSGQIELELEVRAEGLRELLDATVEVELLGQGPDGRWITLPGLSHAYERKRFHHSEGPQRVPLAGPCPPDVRVLSIRVSVYSRTQERYTCEWSSRHFKPEETRSVDHVAFVPGRLPLRQRNLMERIKARAHGLVIVGAEAPCAPDELARGLAAESGNAVVDLDGLLVDAGPGRPHPGLFSAEVVMALLNGASSLQDAETKARGFSAPTLSRTDVSRVVVWPCETSFQRLLTGEDAPGWHGLRDILKAQARREQGPALVLLLPDEMAATLAMRLDSVSMPLCLARPPTPAEGIKEPQGLQDETLAWMARAGMSPDEATNLFERAEGDLRVLVEWMAARRADGRPEAHPPLATLRRWATADLGRLSPPDLLRAVLLSLVSVEVARDMLQPGMLGVFSPRPDKEKKGTKPKPKEDPERVLTADLHRQLLKECPKTSFFRVRGFLPGPPMRLPTGCEWLGKSVRLLESDLRRLVENGFACESQGLYRLALLYRAALEQSFAANPDARSLFREYAARRRLLDGVDFATFKSIEKDDFNTLVEGSGADPHLLKAIGRIWTVDNARPPAADSLALAGFLVGSETQGSLALVRAKEPGEILRKAISAECATLVAMSARGSAAPPTRFLGFVARGAPSPDSWTDLMGALRAATPTDPTTEPLLILSGPGVEGWPEPTAGLACVLVREADVRVLLRAERPSATFWALVRVRVGLTQVTPYRTSVALPPGSPMFVGREKELKEIRTNLPKKSFLIVGARQIGKTSLLNRVFHEERSRSDLMLVHVDIQGKKSQETLLADLASEHRRILAQDPPSGLTAHELMRRLVQCASERSAKAVFLINEIEGFVESDDGTLSLMRSLADRDQAAFVLTGYTTTVAALRDPFRPLYHFTSGYPGQKAFNLSVLEPEDTRALLRWLVEPPLGLTWESIDEKRTAEALILDQSHGIPWYVQQICARLVGRLEAGRRLVLRADDVREILAAEKGEPMLLGYLENTDFAALVRRRGERAADLAARALLLAAADRLYFAGPKDAAFWASVRTLDEATLSFSPEEVRTWLEQDFDEHLHPRESRRVGRYLREFPIEELLRGICLTLLLRPANEDQALPRYCFLKHIYPIELKRAAGRGKSPADRLLDVLIGLHEAAPRTPQDDAPW